jgi:hypothetical protein
MYVTQTFHQLQLTLFLWSTDTLRYTGSLHTPVHPTLCFQKFHKHMTSLSNTALAIFQWNDSEDKITIHVIQATFRATVFPLLLQTFNPAIISIQVRMSKSNSLDKRIFKCETTQHNKDFKFTGTTNLLTRIKVENVTIKNILEDTDIVHYIQECVIHLRN